MSVSQCIVGNILMDVMGRINLVALKLTMNSYQILSGVKS